MNSTHIKDENDTSLNKGLDQLSQRYAQLQRDEPPELLDQAILNSAHRALEKKPHWMKFGWLHGLTTAAVFVLAFSLILNQRQSAPLVDNGVIESEPVSSPSAMVAKKQSLKIRTNGSQEEIKEENEARQDYMLSSSPATPESSAIQKARIEQAAEPEPDSTKTGYATDSLRTKTARMEKDTVTSGPMMDEETTSNKMGPVADTQAATMVPEPTLSARQAESGFNGTDVQGESNSEAQQQLLEIIRLKQSGDETWKSALESFKENYPDYPIPDELVQ
jgi:hypothetical protein